MTERSATQLFDAIKRAFDLSDSGYITIGNYGELISRDDFNEIIASKISGDEQYNRVNFNDAIYTQEILTNEEAALLAEYRTALENWRGNRPSKKVAALYQKIQENDRLHDFFWMLNLGYLPVEKIAETLKEWEPGDYWLRVVESAC